MDYNTVLEVLKYIAIILCGGLSLYFKYSPKAQTKAKEVQEVIANITAQAVIFIKEAEEEYKDISKAGGRKFNDVVERLYGLVPEGLHMIITKEMIADIVQSTFDQIEEYVKLQLDNAIEMAEK